MGCGFVSDAGTNGLGAFTGCADERHNSGSGLSRCEGSPDDCTFQRPGAAFGDEARGVWRVDRSLGQIFGKSEKTAGSSLPRYFFFGVMNCLSKNWINCEVSAMFQAISDHNKCHFGTLKL